MGRGASTLKAWLRLAFLLLLGWLPALGQEDAAGLRPPAHPARPWRIGYVETRTFANYAATLASLARGLKDLGWLATVDGLPYVADQTDTAGMWAWLSSHDLGPDLVFVADGYYTFQGLDGPGRARAAGPIIQRLRERQDLDLVLAMGTDAGKALADGEHRTAVLVFSTSNAVKAGIIKAAQDPARDHVWAHLDPDRYRRQIEVFHDLFRFRKLGIAYEDSPAGRTFAAVDDLEQVAKARGFEVVRERVAQPGPRGLPAFYRELTEAHRRLAARVDAAYLGLFIGLEPERIQEVLAPFVARRIPVFAQQAPEYVRYGALMSVGRADFKGIGRFGAETIVRFLKGTPLRQLPQVYESSPNIILNLEVARAIGYRPTFDILLAADEVYQQVATGKAARP